MICDQTDGNIIDRICLISLLEEQYPHNPQTEEWKESIRRFTNIEEEFDIEIDNEEAEKITTVQDAVEQIKKAVE